jgi:putative flippase GtrA
MEDWAGLVPAQAIHNQSCKEYEGNMIRQILLTHRAENYKTIVRLSSFLCIGGFGAIVNLLCFSGIYYSFLEAANSFIAYGMAFVAGTEVSIVSNFMLNDRLTFGDLHARSWQARCLRYHVTSIGGVLLTLGSSFALLHLLHVPALAAQATALIIATTCNFVFHSVFTYGRVAVQAPATTTNNGGTALWKP